MRFGVLGPIEVVDDARQLNIGGPKQRTVLALLIANAGDAVTTHTLIDGVYGDEAPSGARRSVQTYVSNLRSILGDAIEASGAGYRLVADRSQVDASLFEDAAANAEHQTDPEATAERLREALALWRGHPYADVDGAAMLTTEISRLDELRVVVIEQRVEADLELGRHTEVVAELEALTEEYPLRERFRAQHMLALYRSGRQAEALRAFGQTRTQLVEELGVDPSRELQELEQQILEQDPSLALDAGPVVRNVVVLIADDADPSSLSTLSSSERDDLVQSQAGALDAAAASCGGKVFAHRGSAIYTWFDDVEQAITAAGTAQQSLDGSGHPMRMAVSAGEVQTPPEGTVEGPPVTRAAQLVAAGHGGQVLLTPEANQALVDAGGAGWIVRSLGHHDTDGSGEQRAVYQLVIDGLPRDFPALRIGALPPALPVEARGLPGYELREEVGSGAFGVVHRGYQPSVGREVAIKIIRPEYANDPDFIRRFEVEAQLVARLEHPHIVPLHDYWRTPDGAYLAMRWLRGGTLEAIVEHRPLALTEVDAIVSQIGQALAFAHRNGVVHGDIKASNVLLDNDGIHYLSDFGVARTITERSAESIADDVRGFAQLIASVLPADSTPDPVVDVVESAGTQGAYADVNAFLAAWTAVRGSSVEPADTYTQTRNPYKGLHAFGEPDAADFFGRGKEIDEIIDTLRRRRLTAVVGPSGIGKSSVVRAGVIPALRDGAIGSSDQWLITSMIPGHYPYDELAAALIRVAAEMPTSLEDDLRHDSTGLVRAAQRYIPEGQTVLLVIDQFEELFTLATGDDAAAFLAMLNETVGNERSPVRVILTMRADFFDRPLLFADLGEALRGGTVPISAPNRDSLKEIIVRPAQAMGIRFEPGLVERITTDVVDQPGALPLLEYALTELFDDRKSDTLNADSYVATGGVVGALGRRAESLYADLDDDGRDAGRQVFLRLVNVGEEGRDTRRRIRVTDLERLDLHSESLERVLAAYAGHRLLTYDRDAATRGSTIEVAHEALLTVWTRLAGWIESQREDLLLHNRLAAAVTDWEVHALDESYLLRAGRLAQHEAWTEDTRFTLTDTERAFLSASRAAEDARQAKSRRTRRFTMSGFGIAAVIALVLAGVALLARNDAQDSASLARSRELAAASVAQLDRDPELSLLLALEAATGAESTLGGTSALREALDSHRVILTYSRGEDIDLGGSISPDGESLVTGATEGGLIEAIDIATGEAMWQFDLGLEFGATSDIEAIHAQSPYFVDGGRQVAVPVFYWGGVPAPEGLTGIHFLDAETGEAIRRLDLGECGFLEHPSVQNQNTDEVMYGQIPPCDWIYEFPYTPVVSIDLATGEASEFVELRAVDPLSGEDANLNSFSISRDESRIMLGRWIEYTSVVDRTTGEVVHAGSVNDGGGVGVETISPDGTRIVSVFEDGSGPSRSLVVRNVDTGDIVSRSYGQRAITNVGFSDDGSTVLSVAQDGTLAVWDVETGETEIAVPTGAATFAVDATPDMTRAVVRGGNVIKVISLEDAVNPAVSTLTSFGGCGTIFNTLEVQGDHAAVFALCEDLDNHRAYTFDITTGAIIGDFIPVDGNGIAFSPDGDQLAVQPMVDGIGSVVAAFDPESGDRIQDLEGFCGRDYNAVREPECVDYPETPYAAIAVDLSYSPDGSQIAMSNPWTNSMAIWDATNGTMIADVGLAGGATILYVEYSPDGSKILLGTPDSLAMYSTSDWTEIINRSWPGEGSAPYTGFHFIDDGATVVAVNGRGEGLSDVYLLDAESLDTIKLIPNTHDGSVFDLDVSSDETLIATGGANGFVRLWSVETGELISEIPVNTDGGPADNVAFVDNDKSLLVTDAGPTVKVVNLDSSELVDFATARITRAFTQQECNQYGIDPCPTLAETKAG